MGRGAGMVETESVIKVSDGGRRAHGWKDKRSQNNTQVCPCSVTPFDPRLGIHSHPSVKAGSYQHSFRLSLPQSIFSNPSFDDHRLSSPLVTYVCMYVHTKHIFESSSVLCYCKDNCWLDSLSGGRTKETERDVSRSRRN